VIEQIAFTTERPPNDEVLTELPDALNVRAVIVARDPAPEKSIPDDNILVLQVPMASDAGVQQDEESNLALVREWVDAPYERPTAMMTTLQGVRVFWTRRRFAVLATPDRLRLVAAALAEATYYEAELHSIEVALGEMWPQMEADIPNAFEFDALPEPQRQELAARFQRTMLLSARLARIGPQVHCPHLHPPTLASQVNERLRERTQMAHRHELVGDQVEVFESVYEMCGQRASDFSLATKGHNLERIIIVLLLAQLMFWVFEILTTLGS